MEETSFTFEVSCKKIPGGHYIIDIIGGTPKDGNYVGNYVQHGDRETLTRKDVTMKRGTRVDIQTALSLYIKVLPNSTIS